MTAPLHDRADAELIRRLREPEVHEDEDGQRTLSPTASFLTVVRARVNAGAHPDLEPLFQAALDDLLEHGQRQINPKTGQFEIVPPSPATLKVIVGRIRDLRESQGPPPSSVHTKLREAIERGDFTLPPLDTASDDPATSGKL